MGSRPRSTRIAFERTLGRFESEILVVNVDGSGEVRVASRAHRPSWSPDAARIAFDYELEAGGTAVRVAASDGSGATTIAQDADTPLWSPDGRSVAFLTRGLWLINAGRRRSAQAGAGDVRSVLRFRAPSERPYGTAGLSARSLVRWHADT